MLLLGSVAFAAPAVPGERLFTQPDGSQFRAAMKGDEWFNWVALENGYVALYSHTSKAYEYAVIAPSGAMNTLAPSGVAVPGAGTAASKTPLPPHIKPISPETLRSMAKEHRKAKQQWR